MILSTLRPLERFPTKISGTMSGPDREARQQALAELRALPQTTPLQLVPEPENPYDADAIRVVVALPAAGLTQLGYVKNSSGVCDLCGKTFERFPARGCSGCRHADHLRRDGAATRISAALRADPTLSVFAELLEVTGGEDKCFGCNIMIQPVYRAPGSKETP